MSREPVRPEIIAQHFWAVFHAHPIVGAFAGIPGALVLPSLYARKHSHSPRRAHLVDAPGVQVVPGLPGEWEHSTTGLLASLQRGHAPGPAAGCAVHMVTCRDQTTVHRESESYGIGGKLAWVRGTPSLAWKLLSVWTKIMHNCSVAEGVFTAMVDKGS